MQQQEVLLNQENHQLKQFFFYVSCFIAKNVTFFYRREIHVKFFI